MDEGSPAILSAAEALALQAAELRDCRKCVLHAGRTQVVFGAGNPEADLLFVGEGPGFHEDKRGEPFVGPAGNLLTDLLASIGLKRADVYIANVIKCRPPGNRDPLPEEIESCSPHLMAQVATIRPRVICTLGRFATRLLADTEAGITSIRGKAKETMVAGVPLLVFPVFHPAAALYTPANRAVLEDDFRKLSFLLEKGPQALAQLRSGAFDATQAVARAGSVRDTVGGQEAEEEPRRPVVAPAEQLPLW